MSNSAPDVKNWYCVRSTVGYEARAAELLLKTASEFTETVGEIEVYCPQIRKLMPVAGKRRPVVAPLFPGYFFSSFCLGIAGRFVASRPGIIGLVRFGEQPTIIPATVIRELKIAYADSEKQVLFNCFLPGQRVLISDGPFAGMEAEYTASLSDGQRALLLLEYLHSRVKVVADCQILEPAA